MTRRIEVGLYILKNVDVKIHLLLIPIISMVSLAHSITVTTRLFSIGETVSVQFTIYVIAEVDLYTYWACSGMILSSPIAAGSSY